MAEQVGGGVPEDAVEAQNHLVEITKAQPLDGVLLPRGQRRIELDRVQLVRGLRGDGHLQDAQSQSAKHQIGCK